MRKVLFAAYGGVDFPMLTPVFPILRAKGYELAIMNRYDHPPSREQLRGLAVFQPPAIGDGRRSAAEIERALPSFLDVRTLQHLIPLWRGQTPGLRYLAGWRDHYFDFALETLQRYDPDLVVLSLGEAETAIIRRVCELTSRKYACLVPQRYEFKSIETFEGHDGATYMVAGEYGRERLIRKGIKCDNVLVTGNPRFDHLLAFRSRHAQAPRPDRARRLAPRRMFRRGGRRPPARTILQTLQGVRSDGRLFHLLRRYVASREAVRMVVRPHPNLPLSACLPFVRHAVAGPVSLAWRGTLGGLLSAADVLVTSWSLTILEALITGLPVISWKSDFLPEELPFASRGDTLPVHTYAELEEGLDRLLFDRDFRAAWVDRHRDAHVAYTGVLDGTAALRVAEAIATLVEGGAADGHLATPM